MASRHPSYSTSELERPPQHGGAAAALREVEPLVHEIPRSFRADMHVPARVFADDEC